MAEMDVTAYIGRGVAHFIKDDLDRAIEDFTSAMRLDLNNDTVKGYLGAAYTKRGKTYLDKEGYDKANADFWKAMEMTHEPEKVELLREKTMELEPEVVAVFLHEVLAQIIQGS